MATIGAQRHKALLAGPSIAKAPKFGAGGGDFERKPVAIGDALELVARLEGPGFGGGELHGPASSWLGSDVTVDTVLCCCVSGALRAGCEREWKITASVGKVLPKSTHNETWLPMDVGRRPWTRNPRNLLILFWVSVQKWTSVDVAGL